MGDFALSSEKQKLVAHRALWGHIQITQDVNVCGERREDVVGEKLSDLERKKFQ